MFKTPNFEALKQAGFTLTDMHFHSLYSDTFTRINHILNKASELGINVALTDHNSIEGVRRAYNNRHKVNIIPGIEISCVEGHHILVYFPTLDALEDFYIKHVEGRQNKDPYSSTSIKTEELLDACESYDCLIVAAHPFSFGYYGIMKNIMRGFISKDVLERIHAIEVICGSNLRRHNRDALELVEQTGKPFTGGSDGHSIGEMGSVVVCTKSNTTRGILEEIKQRKNLVIGRENKLRYKLLSGSKLTCCHLPYLESNLRFRYNNLYKKSLKYYKERLKQKLP